MFRKAMDKVMMVIMALVMFLLVCGAVWQVFTRFVLRDPSLFTEEFLRYALIWSTMLGAAYAFSKDMHLSLVLIKDKVKGKAHTILLIFNELVVWAFAVGILLNGGIALCTKNTTQVSAILRIPMSTVYSIIPISGAIIIFMKLLTYYGMFKTRRKDGEEEC